MKEMIKITVKIMMVVVSQISRKVMERASHNIVKLFCKNHLVMALIQQQIARIPKKHVVEFDSMYQPHERSLAAA
jgi:hypothetical protein